MLKRQAWISLFDAWRKEKTYSPKWWFMVIYNWKEFTSPIAVNSLPLLFNKHVSSTDSGLKRCSNKIDVDDYIEYLYMRVVLNSFIWKTSSSPNKFLSPNFCELHVFLSRYMLAKIFKKNVDVWYPQIAPGVWSLVTLHSAAAALKHLRSALRCWSLFTFIGQFWHTKSTV